ncbi:hypothetical protein BASA60_005004 [Batrachochytrium salamandrivorans]|nr:hypothetical protein BASA60_005004 [Batrachochytrium salamandrivorans]
MVLSPRHYLQNLLNQFQVSNYHPAALSRSVKYTGSLHRIQEGRTASPYYETVARSLYAMIANSTGSIAAISQVSKYFVYPPTLTGRQSTEYSALSNTSDPSPLHFLTTYISDWIL